MSLAGLLAAAVFALPVPPVGDLPYSRLATPEADLQQLRQEIAAGRPDALAWHYKIKTYLALGELPAVPELVNLLAATFPGDPATRPRSPWARTSSATIRAIRPSRSISPGSTSTPKTAPAGSIC
jgi:hypothetical protein